MGYRPETHGEFPYLGIHLRCDIDLRPPDAGHNLWRRRISNALIRGVVGSSDNAAHTREDSQESRMERFFLGKVNSTKTEMIMRKGTEFYATARNNHPQKHQ